jgi:hypothetical protein
MLARLEVMMVGEQPHDVISGTWNLMTTETNGRSPEALQHLVCRFQM